MTRRTVGLGQELVALVIVLVALYALWPRHTSGRAEARQVGASPVLNGIQPIASAFGTVRGRLVTTEGDEQVALWGGNITLREETGARRLGATSDENGHFAFVGLAPALRVCRHLVLSQT